MRTFLVTLSQKRVGELSGELLVQHVSHLKALRAAGRLPLAGPLADNQRAVLVLRADSREEAEALAQRDPFVVHRYYRRYELEELLESGDENNWLIDDPQTLAKLSGR